MNTKVKTLNELSGEKVFFHFQNNECCLSDVQLWITMYFKNQEIVSQKKILVQATSIKFLELYHYVQENDVVYKTFIELFNKYTKENDKPASDICLRILRCPTLDNDTMATACN